MGFNSLMVWSLIIEGFLVVLLLVTIYCAIRLNKRLSAIRSDKNQLEKLTEQLKIVTERAGSSLNGFRETAEQVKTDLDEATQKSQAMRDELVFLIERADASADKLAQSNSREINDTLQNKKFVAEEPPIESPIMDFKNIDPHTKQDDFNQNPQNNISTSEAELELISALKRGR
jgi:hypothetical protein